MLTNQQKISRLQAELAEATKKEKAKLLKSKEALLKTAAAQNKLLEKQAEAAIVKIVRQGIFPRMRLTGNPIVDAEINRENKEVDARLNTIITMVRTGDKLGSMRALKVELDAAIKHLEKAERDRRTIGQER